MSATHIKSENGLPAHVVANAGNVVAAPRDREEVNAGDSTLGAMRQGECLSRSSPVARHWPEDIQSSQACQLRSLKVQDALSYVERVKFIFESNLEVYNTFLDTMNDFKSHIIDTEGVINKVSSLFKGHGELIDGFNMFLPNDHKINVAAMSVIPNQQLRAEEPCERAIVFPPDIPCEGKNMNQSPPTNSSQPTDSFEQKTDAYANNASLLEENPGSEETSEETSEDTSEGTSEESSEETSEGTTSESLSGSSHSDSNSSGRSEKLSDERRRAVMLISKIRNLFKDEPQKYTIFLDFVKDFVRSKRGEKGQCASNLNEIQLYEQVAKLLGEEKEILSEFASFLSLKDIHSSEGCKKEMSVKPDKDERQSTVSSEVKAKAKRLRPRDDDGYQGNPSKRAKTVSFRDVSLAEAGKNGTMNDHAFFDAVKRALNCQQVYENFLRCLMLFNQEIVSRRELVQLITPFLGKFPELLQWFKRILNHPERPVGMYGRGWRNRDLFPKYDEAMNRKRCHGDLSGDIASVLGTQRMGASYCALPKKYEHPKCSGRTALCREVLNDAWVSFPTWSEGTTFVTMRKSSFEEYLHQCEEERFELDLVLEINAATIRAFEAVVKRMTRMSPKETARFKLTDCLGGSSPTIHQRAIRQIYGDKAGDIIDGLKKKPLVAVPVVLRRLKAKEDEWRTAQKEFNKVWREQNEKYYLRSLDHQASGFKQNDQKALRSKYLLNDIESLYEERHEQVEEASVEHAGPHLMLPYRNMNVIDDAADLLVHYVAGQAGIAEGDKQNIISLLQGLIRCLFSTENLDMNSRLFSEEIMESESGQGEEKVPLDQFLKGAQSTFGENKLFVDHHCFVRLVRERPTLNYHSHLQAPEERYTMFFGNTNWYLFFRLHHILCDRLATIQDRAVNNVMEEVKNSNKESVATALRLKPAKEMLRDVEIKDYYPMFLKLVKKLLVGSIDNPVYEDTLREMFGIHAYIAFTLDKVVVHAARQLVHLVSDENCRRCCQLFHEMFKAGATGGPCATAHQRFAAEMDFQKKAKLVSRGENCFKIIVYQKSCNVTIELLDADNDESFSSDVVKWHMYVDKYANEREPYFLQSLEFSSKNAAVRSESMLTHTLTSKARGSHSLVFLPRNVRSWWIKYGHSDSQVQEVECLHKTAKGSNRKRRTRTRNAGTGLRSTDAVQYLSALLASDSTQCRIPFKQYRVMFITNKDQLMYRRKAFKRAHDTHEALSRRLNGRFHRWVALWVRRHVSKAQQNACVRWLMGQSGGSAATTPRSLAIVDGEGQAVRPPQRTYSRNRLH